MLLQIDSSVNSFQNFFYKKVSTETNKYAASLNPPKAWTPTTTDDIKQFLFVNIMFGIHQLPCYKNYWSTDELLGCSAVSSVMTRKRFELISRYFHLNDNADRVPRGNDGYDPIFKVRPLFDIVRHNSMEKYMPKRDISFDEAMVGFTGRLHFKQYIKGKPTPWGIKIWCAAESATGYLLDFNVYTGKGEVSKKGLGYDVVMGLGERFLDCFHHFFYDNFFASVTLAKDLLRRLTYSCSTMRTNRKGWPKNFSSNRRAPMKMRQIGNLVACFWYDKRPVNILSTNANPAYTTALRRAPGGREAKQIPAPVEIYNQHMGGVDLHDQYRSYYPLGRRSKKWWRCLVWFLIQVAIINAYHLYVAVHSRSATTTKKLTHLQFRLAIARWLKSPPSTRKRALPETPQVVRGCDGHFPTRLLGRKKTCFLCRKEKRKTPSGRQVETSNGCTKCQLHLCEGTCFTKYHSQF